MSDAGFVIGAWVLTGVVLGGYFGRVVLRIRRAERTRPPEAGS